MALTRLLDDRTLDQVFYPVEPEQHGFPLHSKHPLHPDYRHPPQYPYQPSRGLLGGLLGTPRTQEDIDAEKLAHAASLEKERIQQQQRIAQHRKEFESNAAYKLLNKGEYLNSALKAFRKQQTPKTARKELKHPYAEYRFLRIVAETAGIFLLSDGAAFDQPSPDKRTLKQAEGHIDNLLADFKKGVGLTKGIDGFLLGPYSRKLDQSDLKKLLAALKDEIVVQLLDKQNTARNDDLRKYRIFIRTLALSLKRTFGKASPSIVYAIAGIIACPLDERTLQDLIM